MNTESIRIFHAYNRDANHRVWQCIETLTDDQFVAPVDYSIGSIRNHVVHVMSVDNRWFARLSGIALPPRAEYEMFPTRSSVRASWDTVEATMDDYLARVTDAELQEVIEYNMPQHGGLKRDKRWHILSHVVNHGTNHRAQILSALYRMGAPTVEQDILNYLWESD